MKDVPEIYVAGGWVKIDHSLDAPNLEFIIDLQQGAIKQTFRMTAVGYGRNMTPQTDFRQVLSRNLREMSLMLDAEVARGPFLAGFEKGKLMKDVNQLLDKHGIAMDEDSFEGRIRALLTLLEKARER